MPHACAASWKRDDAHEDRVSVSSRGMSLLATVVPQDETACGGMGATEATGMGAVATMLAPHCCAALWNRAGTRARSVTALARLGVAPRVPSERASDCEGAIAATGTGGACDAMQGMLLPCAAGGPPELRASDGCDAAPASTAAATSGERGAAAPATVPCLSGPATARRAATSRVVRVAANTSVAACTCGSPYP